MHIARWLDAIAEALQVKAGFARGEVHFPVSNDVSFSRTNHISILPYALMDRKLDFIFGHAV